MIIGNEILSGRTQDQNVAFITNWLNNKLGISTEEVRIIQDKEKIIIKCKRTKSKNINFFLPQGALDQLMMT